MELGKRFSYWRQELRKVRDFREFPVEAVERAGGVKELHALYELGNLHGFNGQILRLKYLSWIYKNLNCTRFLETGTRWGYTAIMARKVMGGTTYSVELIKRNYWHARLLAFLTFGFSNELHLRLGDSRTVLREWLSRLGDEERPMVYLDAHFFEDHPLVAEVDQCVNRGNCVVVIDDFKVPYDERFGWDSKKGFDVKLQSISGVLAQERVKVLFPAYKVDEETSAIGGNPRGTCILLVDLQLPRSEGFPGNLFCEVNGKT